MALTGQNMLSMRLVSVYFGLLAVAAAFAWSRRAFAPQTALIAAALLAVSFWPLATSRQALRSGLLPFLTVAAVILFWHMLYGRQRRLPVTLGFAAAVAAALYTYLAARVFWLLFPLFVLYMLVTRQARIRRARIRRAWLHTLAALALAALLATPMFAYIRANPETETRLDMLDRPLQQLLAGDFGPLLKNALDGFLAFVWPGAGDQFLAYNIPGRPVLPALGALFFVAGVAVCLWGWRRPANTLLLGWCALGLLPSLVTGPTAGTTRSIAALPAVCMLAAVGFSTLARRLPKRRPGLGPRLAPLVLAAWLALTAYGSWRDYFWRWGQSPDVRAAYQHTVIEMLALLQDLPPGRPTVISTVYPGPVHDPSIARVLLPAGTYDLRWVDARYALILPSGQSGRLLLPSSTPLHPAFVDLVRAQERFELRPTDLDPFFTLNGLLQWVPQAGGANFGGANFGDALRLLEARWLQEDLRPGDTGELLTVWLVLDPALVGPKAAPHYETDVAFFTHVLDESGDILAQRDALDAPSWAWLEGDIILQVHPLPLPSEAPPGLYQVIVGVYDRESGRRLSVRDEAGRVSGTRAFVVPLRLHAR
jgi:4-amino-4-deoxy-L-arabinose transferase-like glycosyltransferase